MEDFLDDLVKNIEGYYNKLVDVTPKLLLGLAVQGLAAEVEGGVDEGPRQIGRGVVGDLEGGPGPQGLERGRGIDGGDLRKGALLGDDQPVDRTEVCALEIGGPVEAGGQGLELGPACDQCGGMMQRTGSCYTCSSCGNNTGCG